jgi:hypothetical protein
MSLNGIHELVAELHHSGEPIVELYPCCPAAGDVGLPAVVQEAGTVPVVPSKICAIFFYP